MLQIDRVDPSSERDLRDVASLETAYGREVLGADEPAYPSEGVAHGLLHVTRDDIDGTGFLARSGDRAVGFAIVDIRHGAGNEHLAWLPDLYVLPGERRHGIGTRLLDAVVEVATAADRSLVMGGHADDHGAGRAFAEAAGARPGNAERQSRVPCDSIDRSLMQRWIDRARERAPGYSLSGFDDRCPDELLEDIVRIETVMNTAPRPESLDEFVFTPEQRRGAEAERAAEGTSQWVLFARHDESGDVAGYTEVVFRPYRPWLVEQGDTAVDPAHRNLGIGRWLKAAMAVRILDERPEAQVIETWNDGTNAPMLGINVEMGFREVATWRDAELEVGSGDSLAGARRKDAPTAS